MIRTDPKTGLSRSHCAVGRIRYPEALDRKCSLTGDDSEPVKNYKLGNPVFPHQSTMDQFFDDAQFASYRALGDHIAEHAFAPWLAPGVAGKPSAELAWMSFQHVHTSSSRAEDRDYQRANDRLPAGRGIFLEPGRREVAA